MNPNPFVEIDALLAQHCGFPPKEPDFILNYDIKSRLGHVAAGEKE